MEVLVAVYQVTANTSCQQELGVMTKIQELEVNTKIQELEVNMQMQKLEVKAKVWIVSSALVLRSVVLIGIWFHTALWYSGCSLCAFSTMC